MTWYRGDHGYRVYPSGLPDYQLDPPEPDEPELEPPDQERCDACGDHVCEGCGGCLELTCEGRTCGCRAVSGIPEDRWQDALDEAEDDPRDTLEQRLQDALDDATDAQIDDAKVKERVS